MTPSHILTATSALVACMAIWAVWRSLRRGKRWGVEARTRVTLIGWSKR